LNSEGFRETFLRNDREGPTKAKLAEKKEAKQKAGPRGQIEKNREETECSAGVKNSSRRDKRRKAQRAGNDRGRSKPWKLKTRKTPCVLECCMSPRASDGRAI
jgi:hypothetical protein